MDSSQFLRTANCTTILEPVFIVSAVFAIITDGMKNQRTTLMEGRKTFNHNSDLNGAETLFEGKAVPESFAILNEDLYASYDKGRIGKIRNSDIESVEFSTRCEESTAMNCAKTLGLFAQKGKIFIADSYLGVFTYETESGVKTKLFGPERRVAGRRLKMYDAVTSTSDGQIYYSASESSLDDGFFSLLSDGKGKLIHFDPQTKRHRVLIDGLNFANGVALAPDESFVVVTETGLSRIHRFWLKGSKAGTTDLFADDLPGLPDNIRAGSSGFLVSLILSFTDETPLVFQSNHPNPKKRLRIFRQVSFAEKSLTALKKKHFPHLPGVHLCDFKDQISISKVFNSNNSKVIAFAQDGAILDSFDVTDQSATYVSDAISYENAIYLGSPFSYRIWRVTNSDVVKRFQKNFPCVNK